MTYFLRTTAARKASVEQPAFAAQAASANAESKRHASMAASRRVNATAVAEQPADAAAHNSVADLHDQASQSYGKAGEAYVGGDDAKGSKHMATADQAAGCAQRHGNMTSGGYGY